MSTRTSTIITLTDHAVRRRRLRGIPERAVRLVADHGELVRTSPDYSEDRKGRRALTHVKRLPLACPMLRRALAGHGEGMRALTVVVNAWGEVVTTYFNTFRDENGNEHGRAAS